MKLKTLFAVLALGAGVASGAMAAGDEPVMTLIDRETGVVVREDWMTEKFYHPDGTHHRIGGPAFVRRDPVTGVAVLEEWMQNGQRHRSDGPALITRDGKTGQVTAEEWWIEGIQVRAPGPFVPELQH